MITVEQFLEFLANEIFKKEKEVQELSEAFRELQQAEKKLKCLKEAREYLAHEPPSNFP